MIKKQVVLMDTTLSDIGYASSNDLITYDETISKQRITESTFTSHKDWKEWISVIEESHSEFSQKVAQFCAPMDLELKTKIDNVFKEYETEREKNSFFAELSKKSKDCLLLILPILSCHNNVSISIDSSNGNVNIDIHQTASSLLSVQIDDFDMMYFSYTGSNHDLFSITGRIEIDDKLDIAELNRIFNLL